jgi:hypothetical protein
VIIGGSDNSDSPLVGETSKVADQGSDSLAAGHVESAGGTDEVLLGINIPEEESGHGQTLTSIVKALNVDVDRAPEPP